MLCTLNCKNQQEDIINLQSFSWITHAMALIFVVGEHVIVNINSIELPHMAATAQEHDASYLPMHQLQMI